VCSVQVWARKGAEVRWVRGRNKPKKKKNTTREHGTTAPPRATQRTARTLNHLLQGRVGGVAKEALVVCGAAQQDGDGDMQRVVHGVAKPGKQVPSTEDGVARHGRANACHRLSDRRQDDGPVTRTRQCNPGQNEMPPQHVARKNENKQTNKKNTRKQQGKKEKKQTSSPRTGEAQPRRGGTRQAGE